MHIDPNKIIAAIFDRIGWGLLVGIGWALAGIVCKATPFLH